MFSEQRQSIIVDLIKSNGSVTLGELISTFDVSEATVRRDLSELEKRGLLRRTHGGAVSAGSSAFERDYTEELVANTEEKKSIARAAASLINDGDSVLLDSGTTTEQIAVELAGRSVTIITNSAAIPPELPGFVPEVYKVGGLYRAMTKTIVGSEAERFVRSLRPDKAFIGANGVFGMKASTPHIGEAGVKRAMLEAAKEKYLVVDHTKFGKEFLSVFAETGQFDGIITDQRLDEETAEYYRSKLIPVITEQNCRRENKKGDVSMELSDVMSPDYIKLEIKASDKVGAIRELIAVLAASGVTTDGEELLEAVMKREAEFSTGIGFGVAVPHAKSGCVKKAAIAMGRSKKGVNWPSEDNAAVNLIFLVAVPIEAQNQHLRLLAQISRKLIHSEVREKLLKAKTSGDVIEALK